MKIFICILGLIHGIFSEIPPSQHFGRYPSNLPHVSTAPQVVYGIPAANPAIQNLPSTQPAHFNPQIIQPQTQYGVPNRDTETVTQPNIPRFPPSKVQNNFLPDLQHLQGVSSVTPIQPQNQFGAHNLLQQGHLNQRPNIGSIPVRAPQSSYGTPNKVIFQQSNGQQSTIQQPHQFQRPQVQYNPPNNPSNFPMRAPPINFQQSTNQLNNFQRPFNPSQPQTQYGVPRDSGIEPFDLKTQSSNLQASRFSQQQLDEYRTITQDALEFYERIKNFPVSRNEGFQQQRFPSIMQNSIQENLPRYNSFSSQQNALGYPAGQSLPVREPTNFKQYTYFSTNENLAYPKGQHLPQFQANNVHQQPFNLYQTANQENVGYPAGQNLPRLQAANFQSSPRSFQQTSNDQLLSREQIASVNILTPQVQDTYKQVSKAGPQSKSGKSNTKTSEGSSNQEVYLPPTSTGRPYVPVSQKPRTTTTQRTPSESPRDKEQDETDENENHTVAVATAVAGKHFYLLQPDGTLQRFTYNRTQEPGDTPQEYTANFYFKNLPAGAESLYNLNAPLITLG